jgi:hypothetical protein
MGDQLIPKDPTTDQEAEDLAEEELEEETATEQEAEALTETAQDLPSGEPPPLSSVEQQVNLAYRLGQLETQVAALLAANQAQERVIQEQEQEIQQLETETEIQDQVIQQEEQIIQDQAQTIQEQEQKQKGFWDWIGIR